MTDLTKTLAELKVMNDEAIAASRSPLSTGHAERIFREHLVIWYRSGELQRLAELAEDGLKWRREQEQVQKLADKFEKDQDRCPREGSYVRDVEALETERDAMREAIQKYLKERGDPSWWDAGMRRLEQSLNPKNEEGK